jgi:hypothetical protein
VNWIYLIPVAGFVGLLFYEPVAAILSAVFVAAVMLGALWLQDRISTPPR